MIFPPVLIHLDSECEKHLFPKNLFEYETRSGSDILDFLASLTDDDRFLRVGLGIDIGLDGEHREFSLLILRNKVLDCYVTY